MDIEKANQEAVERMMEARPVLIGLGKAIDVIPGMKDNLLLHAGPPITWERASGPMRGAITGALIFEGKAKDMKDAQKFLVDERYVRFNGCPVLIIYKPGLIPDLEYVITQWRDW